MRINHGEAWLPVNVWAEDAEAAQVCAQIHLAAVTGQRVERAGS